MFFVPFIFGKNGKSYNVAAPEQRSEVEIIVAGGRALTAQGVMKMTRAEAVAAVAEQVTPLAEHGGDRKSEDSKSTLRRNVEQQGNSKEYRTAKLARDTTWKVIAPIKQPTNGTPLKSTP